MTGWKGRPGGWSERGAGMTAGKAAGVMEWEADGTTGRAGEWCRAVGQEKANFCFIQIEMHIDFNKIKEYNQ